MRQTLSLASTLLGMLLLAACGGSGCCDDPGGGGDPVQMAPTFLLEDVNPTSMTHQQLISPRVHLGRISAWYFGHAG